MTLIAEDLLLLLLDDDTGKASAGVSSYLDYALAGALLAELALTGAVFVGGAGGVLPVDHGDR